MTMLIELQKELETVKRKSYEEIDVLKYENTHMKKKLRTKEIFPIDSSIEHGELVGSSQLAPSKI